MMPAATCRTDFSFYAPAMLAGAPGRLPREVALSAAVRGAVSPQCWAHAAAERGYRTLAIADVNEMGGLVDFWNATSNAGLHPLIGVEILIPACRALLLAQDRRGYRNLCRITSARCLDPDFDLFNQLTRRHAGLLCLAFRPAVLARVARVVPPDALYGACRTAADAARILAAGFRPVAWPDFNVIDDCDVLRSRLLQRIGQLSGGGGGGGRPPQAAFHRLVSPRALQARFRNYPVALANHRDLVARCRFTLPPGCEYLPTVPPVDGLAGHEQLARLCHLGLARRYPRVDAELLARLEAELDTIRKNRFSDYFLLVREIVHFARDRHIPVDVRGSAAGSLVSHVLGFTQVCPVENQLYFERFMNDGRHDCPDIDIDLCWRRRDEVIDFCYSRWGDRHVAMISTLQRYRRRSAIRDAARALAIPPAQISALVDRSQGLGEGHAPDAPVYRLARELLDVPRHRGLHCGGIVITPRPVAQLAPLQRAAKGVVVTQYDKDAAAAMGLVKIDLLGNRALSTVAYAVQQLPSAALSAPIDRLSPTDKKTARLLTAGDSLGVFQCESPGMRQLLRALRVRDRHGLAIALSLIRPGPAAGGMKENYIARHVHGQPFHSLHPRLEHVLADTHGVMLFQEDVMRVAVELAGYSVADADQFRSEVSKKVSGPRLARQYRDFVYHRAVAAGIDRDTAQAIWDELLRFAAYSYCKAHATVYGHIAWQTAFLKAHHPHAFFTSLLNNHQGMYPLRVYVWDAIRHGIRVLPPHVNHSHVEWTPQGPAIRAGLNLVRHLTHATIDALFAQRRLRPFRDLDDLRRRVPFRRGELESLIHLGACDALGPSRPLMLVALRQPPCRPPSALLFDLYGHQAVAQLGDYDRLARMNAEIAITALPFTLHPALLLQGAFVPARSLHEHIGQTVRVAGYLAAARTAKTRDGNTMAFLTLDDYSGLSEVSFFPDQIHLYRQALRLGGPLWVDGLVSEHLATVAVDAHAVGRFPPELTRRGRARNLRNPPPLTTILPAASAGGP